VSKIEQRRDSGGFQRGSITAHHGIYR